MVVTGVLKDCINTGKTTQEAIGEELESARSLRTARLWVDCLIYPVSVAHMFVRAERKGNHALHMYCLTRIVPYFFTAGPSWQTENTTGAEQVSSTTTAA